jgi:hypothetical protein
LKLEKIKKLTEGKWDESERKRQEIKKFKRKIERWQNGKKVGETERKNDYTEMRERERDKVKEIKR